MAAGGGGGGAVCSARMELVNRKSWGEYALRPELTSVGLGGAIYLPENISDCFVCFDPSRTSGLLALERPVTGLWGHTSGSRRRADDGLLGSNK